MLGGEALSGSLVQRIRRALPDTAVVNMYGLTEACIDATCYRAAGDETAAVLPIGRPLPNYRTYILDARLEPVGNSIDRFRCAPPTWTTPARLTAQDPRLTF